MHPFLSDWHAVEAEARECCILRVRSLPTWRRSSKPSSGSLSPRRVSAAGGCIRENLLKRVPGVAILILAGFCCGVVESGRDELRAALLLPEAAVVTSVVRSCRLPETVAAGGGRASTLYEAQVPEHPSTT